MVDDETRKCNPRPLRRCVVVAHPFLPAFCAIGDLPVVSGTWRVESLGRHHRDGRALWLGYDATEVQLIRWLGTGSPELQQALRRQGFRPWRSFAGRPLWIAKRSPDSLRLLIFDEKEGVPVGALG